MKQCHTRGAKIPREPCMLLPLLGERVGVRASVSSNRLPRFRNIVVVPTRLFPHQYVARPPDRSKTAAVLNEQSSEQSHATRAAASSFRPNRSIGMRDRM